jgi:Carboxypeptidase regulatory-like domain/HYR domain
MKFRLLVLSTMLFFLVGAWLWPSQAQRATQKTSPIGSAARAKAPARTPGSRAQKIGVSPTPVYAQAVEFAESVPVRNLASAQRSVSNAKNGPPEVEGEEINEKNTEEVRKGVETSKPSVDGALQKSFRPPNGPQTPVALPTPSLTFEGIDATDEGNSVAPPDTNGDVGPNHYVQTVNNRVGIWNKNGTLLVPFFTQSSLFAPLGGLAATVDRGDPVVLYDRMADRWLISQFAYTSQTTPPYHEAIAISKNGDPTGGYYLYDFVLPGNEFPDYPHFGVWPDGYYMNSHQFLMGGGFDGDGAFAFDRQKMLVGDPTAGLIYFNLNLATHPEGIFGMLPADHDGLVPPPPGAPNVFVYFTDNNFGDPADGLRLFDFHADFAIPANSTFTERAESTYPVPLPLAAFDARDPGGRGDIEQPPPATNNATDRLDTVGSRLMHRLQYINHGGVESLVGNFTVNVSGVTPNNAGNFQAGIRYFELRRTTPGGLFSVNEQATFAPGAGNGPTGDNRWLGSAAMDNQGNLAVGYTISGVTAGHFPSLNYALRAFNDPPGGLFQGEGTLFAGTNPQRATQNRWGDYSALTLDPTDDCNFWFTSEYYSRNTAGGFDWQTRIGRFKVATCTTPAQGTLAGTITACDTGQPLQYAVVAVTGGPSNGFSTATIANGTYSVQLAPGSYSVMVSAVGHQCMSAGPFAVTINDGATTTLSQCLSGAAQFLFQAAAISGGDGDGIIERDECNNLSVTIKNDGCLIGSNVSAVLSSSTPGVTITQPNSPYPNTAENASSTNSVPFSVSTSNSFVCGTPITFTLTVTFTGGSSSFSFSLPTCGCPTQTVTGSLAAGDLTQTGRMGRNAVATSCAIGKACPGAIAGDTLQHRYDLYSFTNGPTPACVTITTTTSCAAAANQIITAAYLGSFNPTNLCTNYLGDPGGSPTPTNSFKVNVPAGGVLLVNVHEITANGGCSGYTVNVDGLICDTAGNGACQPCQISCPANVTQSNDPNQCGAVVNYPAPTSTGTCGVVSCSPAAGSFFPVGTTTVNCSTTAGPACSFTVTVNDTQAPAVTCNVSTTELWPANHDLINVGLTATAGDNCPNVTVTVKVYGDEDDETPTGDGNFSPDAKNIGVGTLRLRAERKGDGDGRVYLIVVTATDASGNVTRCCKTVTVPKSQSAKDRASVAAQAAAAAAFCNTGAPPPGFFDIGDGAVVGPKQ